MSAVIGSAREPFVSRAPKLGMVGGFDGLRGVGIVMVLGVHAMGDNLESWATIVDAFFVISAFLITSLLLQEHRSTDRIDMRKFYMRRAVRLLPSVWLFCAVWLLLGAILAIAGVEGFNFGALLADVGAALGYVYHLFFPLGLATINPELQDQRTMWHFWSLGVEEWFYFVIATTVLVCIRRNWIKALGIAMGLGFVAIGVARWFAFTGFAQDNESMVAGVRLAFLQRPDALMLGVTVAVINAHLTPEHIHRLRRPVLIAASVAFGVWLINLNLSIGIMKKLGGPYVEYLPTAADFSREHMMANPYWFRFGHTVGALTFAVLAFAFARYPDWVVSRGWSWGPFKWAGRLSYTLYVWHGMPFLILFAITGGTEIAFGAQVVRAPVLILAAFAVAIPVYYLVELRVLRMKLRFSSEKEVLDLRTGKMVETSVAATETSTAASGDDAADAQGSQGSQDAQEAQEGEGSQDAQEGEDVPDAQEGEGSQEAQEGEDAPDAQGSGPGHSLAGTAGTAAGPTERERADELS